MKKAISIILSALVVLSAFLCLTACGKKDKDNTSMPSATDQSQSTTKSSKTSEYAIILKNLSNDFWASMKEGIEEEAKKLGVSVDIYASQSEDDTEGQLKIFENCLNKNYKAIGAAPLSPVNLISAVVTANKKGIYVMNIDEKMDLDALKAQGGSVIAFATTDNTDVGKKGAEYIEDELKDGGKVAIIEGKAGNASGEARKNGATEVFSDNEKLELVESQPADWDRQKALDVATTYIQKYTDLKAIYCCNDTMALGALQAVKNANKLGKIIVVGTDGAAEALSSIEGGELDATVAQNPKEIGATSLRAMVDAVDAGGDIDPNVEPKTIPVDSYIVSKENANTGGEK